MDPIFIFFPVMLVFLYLLLIRPQRQQARRHQDMLQNLDVGDEVITVGGIYGEVTGIDDERVRIAVSRKAIASKVTPEEAAEMAEEPESAPEPEEAPEPESFEAERVGEEQASR